MYLCTYDSPPPANHADADSQLFPFCERKPFPFYDPSQGIGALVQVHRASAQDKMNQTKPIKACKCNDRQEIQAPPMQVDKRKKKGPS
jgi:hypothetical protein